MPFLGKRIKRRWEMNNHHQTINHPTTPSPIKIFLYIYQRGFQSFRDLQTNNLKNITQEKFAIQMTPCQSQLSIRSLKCKQRLKTDLWQEMKNRLKRRASRRIDFVFTMAPNWQRRMEIASILRSAKKMKKKSETLICFRFFYIGDEKLGFWRVNDYTTLVSRMVMDQTGFRMVQTKTKPGLTVHVYLT